MHKLLIIDDDLEVLDINSKNFIDRGFSVKCAQSALEGLALFASFNPDCILLDVMMPGMDGFETCKKIRETSSVPIIFLTGRVSEDDKVSGLLLGANDYIEKPYSLRELEARILVNIRRQSVDDRLYFPPLEINLVAHDVFCDGENLNLSKQEYDFLHMLITHPGEALTYEQIGLKMWGAYLQSDRQTVMMGISRLRKKLEHSPAASRMIETIWSKGYRFVGKKKGK